MYKVICNNIVIDILKTIRYMRYLPKAKRAVLTDRTSANCILASDNKEKYHIQGTPYPDGCAYKTVTLALITEEEYDKLSALLQTGQMVCADENTLKLIRAEKIKEMSEICHETIVGGVSVMFSDNALHHFALTIEDQINLLSLKSQIDGGATELIYHETNCLCRAYKARDISLLIETAERHKNYHTTYFNALKHYINSLYDIEQIKKVEYGIQLSE